MTTLSASYDMAGSGGGYPVTLQVDPPQQQSRLTVFFRVLMVIPQYIVLYFIMLAAAVVTLIAWFAILFTGRYPAGMAGFAAGAVRWHLRVYGYLYLLTGVYPPFSLGDEAGYAIRPAVQPQIDGRNRLTCFFRIILAIPHLIVVGVLGYAVAVVALISWFAALFTGIVPEGLHNFMAGWLRWSGRVYGYVMLLTDEYPPFSLS